MSTTTTPATQRVHAFELAGLGKAPFRCGDAVTDQLCHGRGGRSVRTKRDLESLLFAAGWRDVHSTTIALRTTASSLVRVALRVLTRAECLVIYTHRHVLCVDGRHRVVIDTDRPAGRDRRRVESVLFLEAV